jgi:nitrate/nitrite transporter NarK
MTYMALAVVYLLACVGLGLRRAQAPMNVLITAALALVIVGAQFALLMTR